MTRRLAVNVDVDSLRHYYAIHGLPADDAPDTAWRVGVPRFLELFAAHGLKATFFVVGEDLHRPGVWDIARQVVAQGHELASHTWSHHYDLIRQPSTLMLRELELAEAPIAELRGAPVAGFRAPGYNTNRHLLGLLAKRGYTYDSSLLPCPPYYAARAAIITAMRLVGRHSQSIIGNPSASLGRTRPHRLGSGLIEYPITVLPGVRFPVIGTSLTLLGTRGVGLIAPLLGRMSFVNLEFHALDLLDHRDLGDSDLPQVQRDLRVSVEHKRAAFSAAFQACDGAANDTLEGFTAAGFRARRG